MKIQRLEDKLKLAEELCIDVRHLYKQEIEESLGLRFKRIDEKNIRNKLLGNNNLLFGVMVASLSLIGIFSLIYSVSSNHISFLCVMIGSFIGAGIIYKHKFLEVGVVGIHRWKSDMPYGALLSIKEAKDKGFHDFLIHYPIKKSSYDRYIADPIITAISPAGSLCEIFFWDDRKVYDIDGKD